MNLNIYQFSLSKRLLFYHFQTKVAKIKLYCFYAFFFKIISLNEKH